MADTSAEFLRRLDELSPGLSREFLRSIRSITNDAILSDVQLAVDRGDVDAVVRLLGLEPAALSPLSQALRAVQAQGALFQIAALPRRPRGTAAVRFDGRALQAEAWLRENSSRLITEILDDQREVVRQTLEEGLQRGRSPRSTALDLIGRRSGGTTRSGGVLGLTSQEAGYVARARRELEELNDSYLGRKLRDRRYDARFTRALESGRRLSRAEVEQMVSRYAQRLLRQRAERIARTETLAALNAGRLEQVRQMIERGDVPRESVSLVWDAVGDSRTRPHHMVMDGQTVGYGQPFTAPDGSQLLHPGDASLGAPARMVVNCRCSLRVRVDWLSMAV